MDHVAAVDREEKLFPPTDSEAMLGDPRQQLAQRVVASRQFARSPLLSKFLLHIVAESIANRTSEITEHQIGVQVFDRPPSYRTTEDNIVRNYARQLRRRLADYFAEEGAAEPLHIDIPLGGYVPVFVSAADPPLPDDETSGHAVPISIRAEPSYSSVQPVVQTSLPSHARKRPLLFALLLGLYSAALIGVVWFAPFP